MKLIELLQEGSGITKKITDLKWSFGYGPSKYWQIFDIIANLTVPTLSARSRTQITHLITVHKEYIILAILSKMANKKEYADISTSDIKLSIKKMKELGITWPELDTIQKSLDAEFQRRLTEETVNDSSYGGWIDSKNKKIIYVQHQNHIGVARKLGATGADPYIWMYDRGYVRFITEYSPDNSLAIQGKLEDIKATFAMWWPQARRCETLYVDNIDDHSSKSFFMKFDPQDRAKAQKLYSPQGFKLFEDFIDDHSYGGWINSKSKDAYYIDQEAPDHQELASILGSPEGGYDWMFNRGYVRFVTEDGHRTSLSLEGKLEDIKSIFKQWWPQARKVDDLYIDIINGKSLHFNLSDDPAGRMEAQKLFDPVNF